MVIVACTRRPHGPHASNLQGLSAAGDREDCVLVRGVVASALGHGAGTVQPSQNSLYAAKRNSTKFSAPFGNQQVHPTATGGMEFVGSLDSPALLCAVAIGLACFRLERA